MDSAARIIQNQSAEKATLLEAVPNGSNRRVQQGHNWDKKHDSPSWERQFKSDEHIQRETYKYGNKSVRHTVRVFPASQNTNLVWA